MSMDREVICQLLSALLLAIARPPYVAAEIYFAADARNAVDFTALHCWWSRVGAITGTKRPEVGHTAENL